MKPRPQDMPTRIGYLTGGWVSSRLVRRGWSVHRSKLSDRKPISPRSFPYETVQGIILSRGAEGRNAVTLEQELLRMKIVRIFAHRVELPLHEGSYKWSGGKSVSVFDSTIVGVETDSGLVGHGEVCPLGPFYLPAYAEGVRAGLKELGPHLLGLDPRELAVLNHRMDAALKGHPYVKAGIDIACWDILGQTTGLPVSR